MREIRELKELGATIMVAFFVFSQRKTARENVIQITIEFAPRAQRRGDEGMKLEQIFYSML